MFQFSVHIACKVVSVFLHIGKYLVPVAYGCLVGFLFGAVLEVGKVAGDDATAALDAYSPALKIGVFVRVAGNVLVFHGMFRRNKTSHARLVIQ